MNEKEIFTAAVAIVAAGADTLSAVLQALFHYLLRIPKTLDLLQQEIDDAQLSSLHTYDETQRPKLLRA